MAIDRAAVIRRHNPVNRKADPLSPLSVGNGEFAFTADVTGLQTFDAFHRDGVHLCTMAQWGWHSDPPYQNPLPELKLWPFDTYGRSVGYRVSKTDQEPLFNYLRENPHRLHLGRIGFDLQPTDVADLADVQQELDLWTGTLRSRFVIRGKRVNVRTACHPTRDAIGVQVDGTLPVLFAFPAGSPDVAAADWEHPYRHRTTLVPLGANAVLLQRDLDDDRYYVQITFTGGSIERRGEHEFALLPSADRLSFCCEFGQSHPPLLDTAELFDASEKHWTHFWSTGAAIDLGRADDPRAKELERRIVLSRYLTAIQCSGSIPPAETGLTCNSWFGKFHLEMHWWHVAHFALWDRVHLLERSLAWYERILPRAKELASSQGYAGARWPKMVGPDGVDSPSPIGPLLIWQQPHPIAMAELCYQCHPDRQTLHRYASIVFESAEFMASFAHWDGKRYVLGPPVIPAQENHRPTETWNPTLELAYWSQALKIAQQWRRRMDLPPEPTWQHVIDHLSPLPVADSVYLAHENCPNTYSKANIDHPSMLGAYGWLAGDGVDVETMRRTLHRVVKDWQWDRTWGWDYGMAAMTAARLGEPELAIDLLLLDTPKNRYLPNGHNYQRDNLRLYLPGNGALLLAVAMMAGGWNGAPSVATPGFPPEWNVAAEGFLPLL